MHALCMQVVLVGDFFQLPPVNKDKPPKYAFEGPTWTAFKLLPVYLTKVFRQGNKEFIKLLHEVRIARVPRTHLMQVAPLRCLAHTPDYYQVVYTHS